MGAPADDLNQPLGGTAIKPKGWDRSGMEALRYFLYDPDTGAILSRTPESWAKITAFYTVYYACLATFWLGCLQIFFMTLPENTPRWTLSESIVGNNPGIGVRPYNRDLRVDSSMFVFYSQETADTKPTDKNGEGDKNADYATRMQKFLEPYAKTYKLHNCTDNDDRNKGKCIFDMSTLGECADFPYQHFRNEDGVMAPCVFLKLNKIYGWDPEPIEVDELEAPEYEHMPEHIKDLVRKDNTNVYMDCQGRNQADKEIIQLTYHPANQGIPMKYFPFTGGATKDPYHAPLVAVQINPSRLGQLLHVECKAWYKGVVHNSKDKIGLAQFEFLIR